MKTGDKMADTTGNRYNGHLANICLLILLITAVYCIAINNGFVWDDHAIVQGRSVYRNFDFKAIFLSPGNGLEYLPFRDASYASDYLIWGENNAAGFHATNLIIYVASMCLMYLVSSQIILLLNSETDTALINRTALFVTLCYSLHPIQVQAVNFVTLRNVLLSGLFFYATCYYYLKTFHRNSKFSIVSFGLALFFFIAALLSKATVIILPLVLCIIEFPAFSSIRQKILRTAPFFLVSAIFYFIFTSVAATSNIIATSNHDTVATKIAVATQIPWFYVYKLIFPQRFAAEYDTVFSHNLADGTVILSIIGITAAGLIALMFRRSRPHYLFGYLWFIATLIPVMNFFSTNPVVADRYAYLPSFGLCLVIGVTLFNSAPTRFSNFIAIVILCLLGIMSFNNSKIWKSDQSLWEANIREAPGQIKGYTNLGWTYFHKMEYDKAFRIFLKERELAPDSINYDLAQGYRHFLGKNYPEAINNFQKALKKNDDALYPLHLMARSYLILGDEEKTAQTLNRILLSKEVDFSDYRRNARRTLELLSRKSSTPIEIRSK